MSRTKKIKALGNINCYIMSQAISGEKSFSYNGTTLDLAVSARKSGVKVGQIIQSGGYKYKLIAAPHDSRAGGYWLQQIW